jgi:hypothetical protein
MNALKTIELLRKYAKCQDCGNDVVSNGEGGIEVTDLTFKRTCKCGWSIEVNEEDRPINELIVRP